VVFDLDGTLADTGTDLIIAANTCFVRMGHGAVLDPIEDKATGTKGARAMLRLGFQRVEGAVDEAIVDREYPHLVEAYAQNLDNHTQLYDGAVDAVKRLLSNGYRTAICTNKPEGLADTLMQRLGVRNLFGALVGAGTVSTVKPDAAPYVETVRRVDGDLEKSVLVGDTATDRDTATAAGVASILVTFGPDGDAVADLNPEALLTHYDALDVVVRDLIG